MLRLHSTINALPNDRGLKRKDTYITLFIFQPNIFFSCSAKKQTNALYLCLLYTIARLLAKINGVLEELKLDRSRASDGNFSVLGKSNLRVRKSYVCSKTIIIPKTDILYEHEARQASNPAELKDRMFYIRCP